MEVETELRDGVLIFGLDGKLHELTHKAVESEVLPQVGERSTRVVFDLSKVSMISSAGLKVMVFTVHKLMPLQGKAAVCGLHGIVKDVFDIAGFAQLFEVYEDRDAAVAGLAAG